MYSSPTVAALIGGHFIPVRVHVKQKDDFARLGAKYNAQWTPTTLLIDGEGVERHRLVERDLDRGIRRDVRRAV